MQGKLDFLYTCFLIILLTANCGKYWIFITQLWIVPPKLQGRICSWGAADLTHGGGSDECGRTGLPDTRHLEYTDGHTACPNSTDLPRCDRQAHHRHTDSNLWLRKPIREKRNVVFSIYFIRPLTEVRVSCGILDIALRCQGSSDSVKLTTARSSKFYTIRRVTF